MLTCVFVLPSLCLQSIQHVLTSLPFNDLLTFKTWFYQCERDLSQKQAMEGDLLDFVDMILEKLGI